MAISLPDIVQRVVLDTKGFSSGNKTLNRELTSTAGELGKAADAADRSADSNEKAAKGTDTHTSSLKKLHAGVRSAAPSILRLSDNLYRTRSGHLAVASAADKNGVAHGRLHRIFGKVQAAVVGAFKSLIGFGAKLGIVTGLVLALTPILGGVVGGLGALIGSLGRSIGLLPALASGFVGLIAVLGTAKFLFGGLKDAMKEQSSAGKASASTAKAVARAQEAAGKAVEAAQKRVGDAIKAVQKAAEAEAEAYTNVGVVHYEQSRKIAEAARAVSEAEAEAESTKADVTRAQEALNRSYETYQELLGNLERDSKRASLSERDAVLDLADARDRLNKVNSDPEATARDRERAALDLERAEMDLADARDRAREAEEELTTTRSAGADASAPVTEARNNLTEAERRAAEATQAVADAEQNHFDASVDGWLAVIDAQKQAAEATENTQERLADLAEAQAEVTEAAREGAEAVREAAQSGSSGTDKKKITAPMAALAAAIKDVQKGYAGLKEEGQAVAFPGAIDGIRILGRTFEAFKPQFLGTATVIGDFPRKLAVGLASVQPEIGRVWTTNNNLMQQSSGLLVSIIAAGGKVADASRGILDYFAASMKGLSEQIHTAANAPDAFARMQGFFNRALMSALTWWHIVRDFTIGTIKFFGVGADAGDKMAVKIEAAMKRFREWTDDDGNREKLATFFDRSREMLGKVAWFIGQIAKGFGAIASGPALPAMTGLLDKIFGKSQKDNGLARFIESFGNKAILGGVEAISGLMDVFSGKKEASTNVEKMATSFSRLSELSKPLDVFADGVSALVDGILWMNEHIPGFSTVIGGLFAVMTVSKISGFGSLATGVGRLGMSVYNFWTQWKYGPKPLTTAAQEINQKLSAPVGDNLERQIRETGDAAATANPKLEGMGTSTAIAVDKMSAQTGRMSKFRTGLGKFAGKASAASGAIAGVGGAVWAAGSLMGDSPMADTLNKIGAAMTIAGSISSLVSSFGMLVPAMGAATVATEAQTGAVLAQNAAWYANPIVWVVAAIVALGAALYVLYKKSDTFRKFVDGMWQSIQRGWDKILDVLGGALGWIKDTFLTGLQAAMSVLVPFFQNTIIPLFGKLWAGAKAAFEGVASAAVWAWGNVLQPTLGALGWIFSNVLVPAFNILRAVAEDVFGVIGTVAGFMWDTILKPIVTAIVWAFENVLAPGFRFFQAVAEDVFGVIGTILSLWWMVYAKPIFSAVAFIVTKVVPPAFNFLKGVFEDVLGVMGRILTWTWQTVFKPVFDALVWIIREAVVPAFTFVRDKASAAWDWIVGKVSAAWETMRPIFQRIIEWVRDKVQPIFEKLGEAVGTVWDAIAGAVTSAFEKARSALNTAVRGLGNLLSPLLKAASKIADAIGAKNLAGALSDASTATASWGENSGGSTQRTVSTSSPPLLATGGVFRNARPAEVGAGFKTGVPRAIVGEGSRHPEYVIPTDPKYRWNAHRLLMEAARDIATPRYAKGGVMDKRAKSFPGSGVIRDVASGVGNVIDAVTNPMETLTDIANAARKFGANFMDDVWPHVPEKFRPDDLTGIPGHTMEKVRNDTIEWIRGEAVRRDEEIRAIAGAAIGLNPVFKQMFDNYNAERGNKFSIISGFRTYAEQQALYDKYLRGEGNLAARPGTSNHEKGLAIDHAPNSTPGDRSVATNNWKLHYPVPGEPWHVEPIDKTGVQAAAAAIMGTSIGRILSTIRTMESGGNYTARNPHSSASGAYQFIDSTWGKFGGYPRAYLAPASVQDAKATINVQDILARYANALEAVPAAWYSGSYRGHGNLNYHPGGNNKLTVQQYVDRWMAAYATAPMFAMGGEIPHLAHGGIVTDDIIARVGEAGKEAVVPLDSPRGRRMLGDDDGTPSILLDMRYMTIEDGSDEEKVKQAVKKGVEEALDVAAEVVEVGRRR